MTFPLLLYPNGFSIRFLPPQQRLETIHFSRTCSREPTGWKRSHFSGYSAGQELWYNKPRGAEAHSSPKSYCKVSPGTKQQMTWLPVVQPCWETGTQDALDQGPELLPCFCNQCSNQESKGQNQSLLAENQPLDCGRVPSSSRFKRTKPTIAKRFNPVHLCFRGLRFPFT